jgi:hypothetical protein
LDEERKVDEDGDFGINPIPNCEYSSSPLLEEKAKAEAMHHGYSFDSKKVTDAIGNLNLKVLCRSFSLAIMKHVEFSKGH